MHFKTCKKCGSFFKTPNKHGEVCWQCKLKNARINKYDERYIKDMINKIEEISKTKKYI